LVLCDQAQTRLSFDSGVMKGAEREGGFTIEARERASYPPEALARLSRYDAVVVELGASAEDAQLLKAIKAGTRAPVIALVDTEHSARALAGGADDYVLRSALPTAFIERVNARIAAAEQLREQPQSAQMLLDLTRALVSSLDFQEILYMLVSRIAQAIEVDRVSIVLAPDEGDIGYVVAASDDQKLRNLRIDLTKYPEIRHVLRTRVPLTVNDVDNHPLLDELRRSVAYAGLTALTLVPIVSEGAAMGVIFIRARTHRGALNPEQLQFAETLANATAIALRNARILQSLRDESQRDVFARIEAEKRLSALTRYADLLTSSADGIAAFDRAGYLIFANPSAAQILGYNTEAYLGRPMWDLVPPAQRKPMRHLRRRLASGLFPHDVDIHMLHQDGRALVINGSFAPLGGTEGAVLLSFRDVTEDRRTRDELLRTRNFLQSLIDASVDAIVAADMKGTIILFNQGAQELYGYPATEVIGKLNARRLYPGDGAREVMRMLRGEMLGGPGRLEPVRIEAVDSTGNIFPISLTAAFIYEGGVPTASFGIFTDLRERVRFEQQLAQAQEQLAMSEKASLLAELAGATAHELNQPLTSVMGYAELLTRRPTQDASVSRAANYIHQEASRMAEIVRKIGQLTRYETKSYVGDQRILDLDRGSSRESDPKEPKQ
jgi:PAS domain S-box-containing protein